MEATKAKVVGPEDGKSGFLGSIGVRFMIDGEETDGGFSLVEHPMSPRALAAPLHRHNREDEYTYVLEGKMGALLGDEVLRPRPGDLVFKPRDQWHTFWNAGDEPCRILEIIAPAGFERFFEELSDMGGAMKADPQELARASASATGRDAARHRARAAGALRPGGRGVALGLVQQLVRLGPLAGRHAQGDVAPAVFVQLVVRGDHRLVPGVGELLAPGAGGLEVLEVADDVPVVVVRIADLELGEAVGMERVIADAEELAELVADTHAAQATRWPGCR